jgi:hypothetical protein
MLFFKKPNKPGEVNEIKPKPSEATVTEFVKRPVPTKKQVDEFNKALEHEKREEEIEESLEEIYRGEDGRVVDVSNMTIRKKGGLVFWFLSTLFFLAVISGIVYGGYYYYMHRSIGTDNVRISLETKEKVTAGEEFSITIDYSNSMSVKAQQAKIEAIFPQEFILLDSEPSIQENNSWNLGDMMAHSSGQIRLKGRLINTVDSSNLFSVKLIYMPENFSSEFKKESAKVVTIKSIGYDIDSLYSSNALVGDENQLDFQIKSQDESYINNFRLLVEEKDNLQVIDLDKDTADKLKDNFKQVKSGVWEIINIKNEEKVLPLKYKYTKKVNDSEDLLISLVFTDENGKDYKFYDMKVTQDIVSSDLNLSLEVNGQKGDSAVDFGSVLEYSLKYSNVGQSPMKDLVLMAVIDGDLLDWKSLSDENKGTKKNNAITWSKLEVPMLNELNPGQEGEIKFSIKVLPFDENDLGKKFEIKSYAQFSIGNADELKENTDNQSNVIINKINSDLSLDEQLRYFDDDNMPVGTGALPPKVGETTTLRVYWTVKNNLHEMESAKVEAILPAGVDWFDKSRVSVGTISYDSASRKVTWQIGRLPIYVYRADAEFSISITPQEDDRGRILVLLPGSKIEAVDTETKATLSKSSQPKTTRLEDDTIAGLNNDGMVR